MKIFTIGFTKKSAEKFFSIIKNSEVKRIVDIRLNNVSQLAGFAKRDDLRYFLKAICNTDYIHMIELAPTKEILDEFKKNGGNWLAYEKNFLDLLINRNIEKEIKEFLQDGDCLLCSEDKPVHCHRRLLVEYLQRKWGNLNIKHL